MIDDSMCNSKTMIRFFRWNGQTFGIDFGEKHPLRVLKPIRECSQFEEYRFIMEAAERALNSRHNGMWVIEAGDKEWQWHPIERNFLISIFIAIGKMKLPEDETNGQHNR